MTQPRPLAGRDDALSAFRQCLARVARGSFRMIELVGEPGAGKTRLLDELAEQARAAGCAVARGRASEFERDAPLALIADALDDDVESRAQWITARLGAARTHILSGLFPALAGPSGEAAPITAAPRNHLHRAVHRLLEALAGTAGLALLLDDVHWADEASIELLGHLIRHPPDAPLLLAVAFRHRQQPDRLAAALAEAAAGARHRIEAAPLTLAEAAAFLGSGVTGRQCRRLHAVSGGNPFYLDALARATGYPPGIAVDPTAGVAADLPSAVREALAGELGALPAHVLLIARAAAVTGDESDAGTVSVAAQVDEATCLAGLDELVARDIMRANAATGRFRFRHPLVRHLVYASAGAGWRVAAHGRIAGHLERTGAGLTSRAGHVARSARPGDQHAVALLTEAACATVSRAPATAADWLQAALGLLPDDEATGAQRVHLLTTLARAQGVSGRLLEGRDTAREALRLVPEADWTTRAHVARFCAILERLLGRPDEGRAVLLAELARMPAGHGAAAPLQLQLAGQSLLRGEYQAAAGFLAAVSPEAAGPGGEVRFPVTALRPVLAYAADDIDNALTLVAETDQFVAACQDAHLAPWLEPMLFLCWTDVLLGRYRQALGKFDRAVRIADATGQIHLTTWLLTGRATAHGRLGELREATACAEDAMDSALLLGSPEYVRLALVAQCRVAAWSGDHPAAFDLAEQAAATGGGDREWSVRTARVGKAMALVGRGRLDEGAALLLDACDGFDSPRLDRFDLLTCCEVMADAEAARGQAGAASVWARRAESVAHPGLPGHAGLVRLARAHAAGGPDPSRAAADAIEAAELLTRAEQRLDTANALLRAGTSYAAAGDRTRARAELARAVELFTACGAPARCARAVRELRRLGVRVTAPSASGHGEKGLTRREGQVARLVARGYTNQRIAEELFVSTRTVETHIAHIFAKLGVCSRAGLVGALADPPDQ